MSLKPNQVTVGAVVYLSSTQAPLKQGKILAPLDNTHGNNLVVVEWHGGQIQKIQCHMLLSEADGAAENQRLLAEQEKMEREFELVQTECAAKLAQAAKLVREAGKLAQSKGQDLLEMYDATRELERAMGDAGWNTSSWHC